MKMSLRKDCIKVELGQGEQLPTDVHLLEPYHWNRKKTIFYFSLQRMPEVLKVFNKDTSSLPKPVADRLNYILWQRDQMQTLMTYGPQESPLVTPQLTLRRHQQLAREVAKVHNKYAFYYDTRTGKTPTSISIILDDIRQHPNNKWLVVAPLILLDLAWGEDFAKFAPELKVSICHANSKKKRLEKIAEEANVYIINTESYVNYAEYFTGISRMILDESSSMKNKSSKFSKAIVEFSRTCDRLYLLSGTPAPNGAWEYYSQIRALDYYGIQQSYAQFKLKYFLNLARDVRFEQLVLRQDMADELQSLIANYALYVDKEDVLKTPGRSMIEYTLVLPDTLKTAYKQMKSDLATEVNGDTILAPSAAAKLNKLNQITSGFLMNTEAIKQNALNKKRGIEAEDETEWHLVDNYRFNALLDLLNQIGDTQVIIWANYHIEFEIIKQLLGNKCRTVYGATSSTDKIKNVHDFKAGKVQYLVANPASADKGLTLTNCHVCVYFSLNWSYELFKQSMDRIYGDISIQPHECKYYIMMAKRTIDEVLYREVLIGKQTLSYAILDHLKAIEYE